MSSGVDVQRRPGIWSYFSFNSGPRRRVSVSLPRNNPTRPSSTSASDPWEKPNRHSRHPSRSTGGFMNDIKSAAMNQGQRTRYIKTGGVIAFILLILYFVAPKDAIARGRSRASMNRETERNGSLTCICRIPLEQRGRWPNSIAGCKHIQVHEILLQGQAADSIRPHDRCWFDRFPYSRLQVQ